MRLFFPLLAVACSIVSTATAGPLPDIIDPLRTGAEAPDDVGVVIGLEDYAFVPDVPFATRDANAVYNFLIYTRGVPEERVQLLTSGNDTQILAALRRARDLAGPDSRVWVYFAGHGGAAPNTGERLLLGDDVKSASSSWSDRAVTVGEVQSILAGTSALVVLDACFTGVGRGGAALTDERFAVPSWALNEGRGVTIWGATSATQSALPLDDAGHGLFTYFAVGALRGWADGENRDGSRDGTVTLAEAQSYVSRAMRTVQVGEQQPQVVGAPVDDLVDATEEGPDLAELVRPDVDERTAWALDADAEHVVELVSEPTGAAVSVDGAYLCDTPCSRALVAGRHEIEMAMERYDPALVEVDVFDLTRVEETLVPRFGFLTIESTPPGIAIEVVGETFRTPVEELRLGFGGHRVQVKDPLWEPLATTIEVRQGEHVEISLEPDPRLGGLKVVARDADDNDLPVDVRVDGERVGRAPWTGEVQVGRRLVQAGDARQMVEIEEAAVEQVVLRVRDDRGRAAVPLTIGGASLASGGLAMGALSWGAAADPASSLAALQVTNTLGWTAATAGGAIAAYGVGHGLRQGTLRRGAAVGAGCVGLVGGATLGVVSGILGREASTLEAFERFQTLNTVGWSTAAGGTALGVAGFLVGRDKQTGIALAPGQMPMMSIGGTW